MSSSSPLQCLFCNHINPGGASFCNDCGSQLHLQQCDLCGSINKRSARLCYKCGATFTLSATHGLHSPILENAGGGTALAYAESINAAPVFSKSAVDVIRELNQTSPAEGSAVAGSDVGVEMRETVRQTPSRANSSTGSLPEGQMNLSDAGPGATKSRCRYPFAILALVFSGIVLSVYCYRENFRQGTQEQRVEHTAPVLSGDSVFSGATLSAVGDSGEEGSEQTGAMSKFALRILGFGPQTLPPPTDLGITPPTRALPSADSAVAQGASVPTGCQEEVATLGLCNPIKKQERP